ncbi:MAG TPA: hypothetical protein VNS60_02335 [Solirubrobacterales bacterium]|nr:hypothetical protein [Solirubrobacterales bacterium]
MSAAAVGIVAAVGGRTLRIEQGFYQAAASILPLLLLAHLVRLGTLRDSIFRNRKRFDEGRQAKRDVARRLAEAQAVAKAQQADPVLTPLEEAEIDLKALRDEIDEAADEISGSVLQLVAGNLIATLIVGCTGISSALIALARGVGTNVLFICTGIALGWVMLALLIFELLIFFDPPRS